jgi:ribosomal protein S18 acetylase RimI-like enzyme
MGTRAIDLTFHRYSSAEAREIRATVEEVYTASYTEAIATGEPFDTPAAFMGRFDSYIAVPGVDLVVAWHGDKAIGQTWGWPLDARAGAGWWAGLLTDPGADFIREDGTRTFALSEIMVRREHTGQHIAHALHDELLSARPEQRATLLVEPDNTRAYRAYLRWGWQRASQLRPHWQDAPVFDVLILPLPLVLGRRTQ